MSHSFSNIHIPFSLCSIYPSTHWQLGLHSLVHTILACKFPQLIGHLVPHELKNAFLPQSILCASEKEKIKAN